MIYRTDVVRLGFGSFDASDRTIRDLNETLQALQTSAALQGTLSQDAFMSFAMQTIGASTQMEELTDFEKRVIRNYYLLKSVLEQNVSRVEEAIRLGASIDEQCLCNGVRYFPLIAAASSGNKGIVETLIRKGGNVNIQQLNGENALAIAANADDYAMAKCLLENGANPNLVAYEGITPLAVAENARMVRLLLDYGADPNIPDCDGDLPIIARMDNFDVQSVAALIEAGTDLDRRNNSGETARQHASRIGMRI